MKKIIALALTLVMVFALFAVGGGTAFADDEGKVFNIYAWNEEFKGFFEKYYTVPEGVTVNWIITPSDNGAYQQKLDEALMNQDSAAADDKVDMFLAEADYILKYVDSDATQDVQALGVTDFSNTYAYVGLTEAHLNIVVVNSYNVRQVMDRFSIPLTAITRVEARNGLIMGKVLIVNAGDAKIQLEMSSFASGNRDEEQQAARSQLIKRLVELNRRR